MATRARYTMTPAVCIRNSNSNRNNPCARRGREGIGV